MIYLIILLVLLFFFCFMADMIRDKGVCLNLILWKINIPKFNQDKFYRDNTLPVNSVVHRMVLDRGGFDVKKVRILK